MPRPPVGDFAELLYDRIEPATRRDEALGWPLLYFCEAIGKMFEDLNDLVGGDAEQQFPWQILFQPENVPLVYLPFAAQFVGVRIPSLASEELARLLYAQKSGFARGTPVSMMTAIQNVLTGSKQVRMVERIADAYGFTVHTLTGETPDEDAVHAAIRSQKPAGLQYELVVSPGDTWDETTVDWDSAGTYLWQDATTLGIPG